MDQRKQCTECHGFVPMVEGRAERRLALDEADECAQDDRHPEQRGKASGEADVAEGSKAAEQGDAYGKACEDLCRAQTAQHVPRSCQGSKLPEQQLAEMVAADRLVERIRGLADGGNARLGSFRG